MAVDELRLGGVGVQIHQQQAPIGDRPADDMRRVRRQIQCLAFRSRMQPHQSLRRRRILLAFPGPEFGEADLTARPEHIVLDHQIVQNGFRRVRQGVIGGAHVGEFGLAVAERAGRRDRHRMQQAQDDGDRHVGRIGVPQPIAQTVQPATVV